MPINGKIDDYSAVFSSQSDSRPPAIYIYGAWGAAVLLFGPQNTAPREPGEIRLHFPREDWDPMLRLLLEEEHLVFTYDEATQTGTVGTPRFAHMKGWGKGNIDAAVYCDPLEKFILFKGSEFIVHYYYHHPDKGFPQKIIPAWGGFPRVWGRGSIDAALFFERDQKFFLFKGDEYVKHSWGEIPAGGYPKKIAEGWTGWPSLWTDGNLDAAMYCHKNRQFYFFRGTRCITYSWAQREEAEITPIAETWAGWPEAWAGVGIDAALYYEKENCFYFFRGAEYIKKVFGQPVDPEKYPRLIAQDWKGWPG